MQSNRSQLAQWQRISFIEELVQVYGIVVACGASCATRMEVKNPSLGCVGVSVVLLAQFRGFWALREDDIASGSLGGL